MALAVLVTTLNAQEPKQASAAQASQAMVVEPAEEEGQAVKAGQARLRLVAVPRRRQVQGPGAPVVRRQ